jgi:hypothetical protein
MQNHLRGCFKWFYKDEGVKMMSDVVDPQYVRGYIDFSRLWIMLEIACTIAKSTLRSCSPEITHGIRMNFGKFD